MIVRHIFQEYQAACTIQAAVRTCLAVQDFGVYISSRKIQTWYRSCSTRSNYVIFISARKIQARWRGCEARRAVGDELWIHDDAATSIQKTWRIFFQFTNYTIMTVEKEATTRFQQYWRGCWQYSHYIILRFEIVCIQNFSWGCAQCNYLALQNDCASVIQRTAFYFLANKNYHMEQLITAMMQSATMSLSIRLSSKIIQRCYSNTRMIAEKKHTALVIKCLFIWERREVEEEIERREKMKLVK